MVFAFDEFEFDPEKLELSRSGKLLKAESLVLRLLHVLVDQADRLVTKQQLITRVWGDRNVSDNVVTVTMVRLRRLLGHRPNEREFVINVHGRGYRFVRPVIRREPVAIARSAAALPIEPVALPFVGRERVLERLRSARNAARTGRGSACVLIGEPGIGKTSIVEMLEREEATSGMTVAWGYCREAGATPPLWPFAQLARDVVRKLARVRRAHQAFEAAAELERMLAALETGTSELFAAHGAALGHNLAEKHRLFDGLTHALKLAAEHAPCVLVLDDLHRADVASLQLVDYWIDELARTPILLLGTMRRSAEWRQPTSALVSRVLGHRNCTRLELEPLSLPDVQAYVNAVIQDPTGELSRAVYLKSEGNPFFMVELSRQLAATDGATAAHIAVSKAALDLVRQRVWNLDDEARGVLSSAAVVGRSFELGLLQAVTGLDSSTLMQYLDLAVAADAVQVGHDSRTTFAFAHDLLREALYDSLPLAERRRQHLRVALALEQRAAAGDAIPAADLAHHFEAALPDSDLRKTVQYCSQAGTAAAAVCAYPDAVRHLRRARATLDLMENPSPRLRTALALRQATYARVCSSPDFRALVDETLRLARAHRSGNFMARAGLLLDIYPGFPPLPGARTVLESALEFLTPEDAATHASVLARLATSGPLAYDAEAARAQADRALELCQKSNSVSARLAVQFARLYLWGGPGHEARAAELLAETDALCAQRSSTLSVFPILLELQRCIAALQRGQLAASNAALDRCEYHSRRLGGGELMWHIERFRLLAQINAGQTGRELTALHALHRRAAREKFSGAELFCAYDQSVVLGDTSRAARDHLRCALAADSGDSPAFWAVKVRGLAAAGLRDEARSALYGFPADRLHQLPRDRDHLGTLGALTRAALALDAREYIEALYPLLLPHAEHFAVHVSFLCEGSVAQLLGLAAQALGRHDEAVRHLRAAVATSERAGLGASATDARSAREAYRLRV